MSWVSYFSVTERVLSKLGCSYLGYDNIKAAGTVWENHAESPYGVTVPQFNTNMVVI